jgi:hypothetical protein
MLVYNITTKVENEIEDDWLKRHNDIYVSEVMARVYFLNTGVLNYLGRTKQMVKHSLLNFLPLIVNFTNYT